MINGFTIHKVQCSNLKVQRLIIKFKVQNSKFKGLS